MAYIDEMKASGNWLFRWRSYLPVLFIGLLLLSMTRFTFLGGSAFNNNLWASFCLLVCAGGLLIRVLTVGYTPASTSGRNAREQRAAQLNTTGAYSLVRHPLYVGNYLLWLGVAMYPRDWLVALACTCVYWLYYERIVIAEEAFIAEKFGAQFDQWAASTPVFVPNFRRYVAPDNSFSMRNALKREYPALSAMILSMFILAQAGNYKVLGHFALDRFWTVLLVIAVGSHLLLRSLKKHTRLLHVGGR